MNVREAFGEVQTFEFKANPYVKSATLLLCRFVCTCGHQGKWYVYEGNARKRARLHRSTHTK